ncbi:site-specific integrase [Gordonia malaquae]|uniref:tyrosine-type recombinase/integrase n=1 Tax=Gordonia malaquae TaxID=410332 RepID=UPI0030FE679D
MAGDSGSRPGTGDTSPSPVIEKLPSGKWRVRLYVGSAYVASRTFDLKRDARDWEARQATLIKSGSWTHPDDAATPYRVWLDEWMATCGGAPLTVKKRKWAAEYASDALGRLPLSAITPLKVKQALADITEKTSGHTAYQVLVVMRQSLGAAVQEGLIPRDPTVGAKVARAKANEPHPLTHAELWRLADVMTTERDRVQILTMGYSGVRWGEIVALAPDQASVRGIRLTSAYAEVGGRMVRGDLKDHDARSVPLPTRVLDELIPWAQAQQKLQRRHLFGTANDTPHRNGNWRRSILTPALARADLPLTISPHNFRDTAASLAIEAGASVLAVSRMLGHENPSTTLTHYASLFPDTLDGLITRLDSAIANALVSQENESEEVRR